RLKQRSYQDREGQNRVSIELEVDEIGPSLRYATAQVTRTSSSGGGGGNGAGGAGGGGGGQQSRPQVADEPWATPGSAAPDAWSAPGAYGDDTPF
ncbi:single-stranded DNA-binding protein, partial [Microbacterium sp. zg.Y909]|nr:single-stranded DNA-binding protein [Microbacterium sp. zg.Y909]